VSAPGGTKRSRRFAPVFSHRILDSETFPFKNGPSGNEDGLAVFLKKGYFATVDTSLFYMPGKAGFIFGGSAFGVVVSVVFSEASSR